MRRFYIGFYQRFRVSAFLLISAFCLCLLGASAKTLAATAEESVGAADTSFNVTAFAYLVQLTEAVLAPAWSVGGYAYAVDDTAAASSNAQQYFVCVHARSSAFSATAPVTFSAFDAQFSPLYFLSGNSSAAVVGRLDLQHMCYADITSSLDSPICIAEFISEDEQCPYGGSDALRRNWTADDFLARPFNTTASTVLPPSAAVLSAAELFILFLNDYAPQRAWLRTVVPRSLDLLESAALAARAYVSGVASLTSADETADMQRAQTTQLTSYLWRVYAPQLRRKWDLLYDFAVTTLTPGGLAASAAAVEQRSSSSNSDEVNVSLSSITGIPSSLVVTTRCALVDAWPSVRYHADSLTVDRLVDFMADALADVAAVLQRMGSRNTTTTAQEQDALLADLQHSTYCVTTTNLFAIMGILDRPFLQIFSSVWLEDANHTDSWAWQAMTADSVAQTVSSALAFQTAAARQISSVYDALTTTPDRAFLRCLARFIDPTAPLTSSSSSTVVSPADCIQQLLSAQHDSRGASVSAAGAFNVIFELANMSASAATPGAVPGLTRYESKKSFPYGTGSANATLAWVMVQESLLSLTAQTSVFTPARPSSTPSDSCAVATSLVTTLTGEQQQQQVYKSVWDWAYECDAGSYVLESNASCTSCPSACANPGGDVSVPVYCPGDGLMHGCPFRPSDAVFIGPISPGQTSATSVCRYGCLNPYAAPINYSCLSVSGTFFNSTATGNADLSNGGGLTSCDGPLSMFPEELPFRSSSDIFRFVGSGTRDAPLSCPFTLLHRVTSSAVGLGVLTAVGAALPPPFAGWSTNGSVLPFLSSQDGVTWDIDVQLNASQLHAMHAALRETLEEAEENQNLDATTIAHELMSVHTAVSADASSDTRRVAACYLLSTVRFTDASSDASAAPIHFQLLLNVSTTVNGATLITNASTPAPSALIVESVSWLWWPSSAATETASYRVALDRLTNTITFFVNSSTPLGGPVVVDWPQWISAMKASAPSSSSASASYFFTVGGWVGAYTAAQQWVLVSDTASSPSVLPLSYDYLPGMVVRIATAPSPVNAVQDRLRAAEVAWNTQADADAVAQALHVAQLTSLDELSWVTAARPMVSANLSSTLHALALRTTRGLDGVCRPGYGNLPASATAVCDVCVEGAYTVLNASAGSNLCACLPQRVRAADAETQTDSIAANACVARVKGPAIPQAVLSTAAIFYIDEDVTDANSTTEAHIPIGWYAADASTTTSLDVTLPCLYGLTVPAVDASTTPSLGAASLNTSAAVLHTTGLGGERCHVAAAARSGTTSLPSAPTYAAARAYDLRLRAPALTTSLISLDNNSALFSDQTVLVIAVREYALLPFYAVHSLLQMSHLTEYQLAFLAYVLRTVTVSAELTCGAPAIEGKNAHVLTWASGGSSLATAVLWLNLTQTITQDCTLQLRVTSTAAGMNASLAPPFSSWPYSYLRAPPSVPASSFLQNSTTLTYVLRAPSRTFASTQRHHVLGEVSSFVITGCLALLSLALGSFYATSIHVPSLHPLPWQRYERENVKTLSDFEDF